MRIGPYTYTGFVTFPGTDSTGYSFTIGIGRKRIAAYVEHGSGGEPDLYPVFVSGDDKGNAWRKAETEKLRRYADENAPDWTYGGKKMKGDYAFYFESVMGYHDLESAIKKSRHRYPPMPYIGLLLNGAVPESFIMLTKPDLGLAASKLIDGKEPEDGAIAIIRAPEGGVLVLEDGLPAGTPAKEIIGGTV